MTLPFRIEAFLQLFADYNTVIWPAQIIALALGMVSLVAVFVGHANARRFAVAALGVLWAFTGIGYHLVFFSRINPVAPVFAGFFIVQALLFLACAVGPGDLRFQLGRDVRTGAGLVTIFYALAIYPVLGLFAGHGLMAGPMFGVTPCPTTIFTLGMLLLMRGAWVIPLSVVPLLWSLVGMAAAVQLGIAEDLGLPVAGLVLFGALGIAILRHGRGRAGNHSPRAKGLS